MAAVNERGGRVAGTRRASSLTDRDLEATYSLCRNIAYSASFLGFQSTSAWRVQRPRGRAEEEASSELTDLLGDTIEVLLRYLTFGLEFEAPGWNWVLWHIVNPGLESVD